MSEQGLKDGGEQGDSGGEHREGGGERAEGFETGPGDGQNLGESVGYDGGPSSHTTTGRGEGLGGESSSYTVTGRNRTRGGYVRGLGRSRGRGRGRGRIDDGAGLFMRAAMMSAPRLGPASGRATGTQEKEGNVGGQVLEAGGDTETYTQTEEEDVKDAEVDSKSLSAYKPYDPDTSLEPLVEGPQNEPATPDKSYTWLQTQWIQTMLDKRILPGVDILGFSNEDLHNLARLHRWHKDDTRLVELIDLLRDFEPALRTQWLEILAGRTL